MKLSDERARMVSDLIEKNLKAELSRQNMPSGFAAIINSTMKLNERTGPAGNAVQGIGRSLARPVPATWLLSPR